MSRKMLLAGPQVPCVTAPATPTSKKTPVRSATYHDGTYCGVGSSSYGDVQVSVSIRNSIIETVKITQITTFFPSPGLMDCLPRLWHARVPLSISSRGQRAVQPHSMERYAMPCDRLRSTDAAVQTGVQQHVGTEEGNCMQKQYVQRLVEVARNKDTSSSQRKNLSKSKGWRRDISTWGELKKKAVGSEQFRIL